MSVIATRAPSSTQRFAVAKPMPVPGRRGDEHGLAREQAAAVGIRRGVGASVRAVSVIVGSLGRPSARSPMTLRWISFEPP